MSHSYQFSIAFCAIALCAITLIKITSGSSTYVYSFIDAIDTSEYQESMRVHSAEVRWPRTSIPAAYRTKKTPDLLKSYFPFKDYENKRSYYQFFESGPLASFLIVIFLRGGRYRSFTRIYLLDAIPVGTYRVSKHGDSIIIDELLLEKDQVLADGHQLKQKPGGLSRSFEPLASSSIQETKNGGLEETLFIYEGKETIKLHP